MFQCNIDALPVEYFSLFSILLDGESCWIYLPVSSILMSKHWFIWLFVFPPLASCAVASIFAKCHKKRHLNTNQLSIEELFFSFPFGCVRFHPLRAFFSQLSYSHSVFSSTQRRTSFQYSDKSPCHCNPNLSIERRKKFHFREGC